jgi:hypothetical protein
MASDTESRPAQPASIRGPRRVGFNPVSQKPRAVHGFSIDDID